MTESVPFPLGMLFQQLTTITIKCVYKKKKKNQTLFERLGKESRREKSG